MGRKTGKRWMLEARVWLTVALSADYDKTCGLSCLYIKALSAKVKFLTHPKPWHKLAQNCLRPMKAGDKRRGAIYINGCISIPPRKKIKIFKKITYSSPEWFRDGLCWKHFKNFQILVGKDIKVPNVELWLARLLTPSTLKRTESSAKLKKQPK